jgi:uncharacterized caspase-like protein
MRTPSLRRRLTLLTGIAVCGGCLATSWAGIMRPDSANPDVPGRLFVLAIGINHYPEGGMISNQAYAEGDATAIAAVFAKQSQGAFTQVIAKLLRGSEATLAGIRNALHDIALHSGPNDTLVFYFAGSGFHPQGSAQNDYAFTLSNSKITSLSDLSGTLSSQELATLLYQIPTQKQIIILDSCDTKAALDAIREALDGAHSPGLQKINRRVALIGVDGTAWEFPQVKHGLLTYCILQALNGGADVDHTGLVSEGRLEGYLTWKLPEVAASFGLVHQQGENLYGYSTLRDMVLEPAQTAKEAEAMRGSQAVPEPDSKDDPGKDYALFVATDYYANGWDALRNPVHDAHTIGQELIDQYGYDGTHVSYLDNPTEDDFLTRIEDLHKIKFGAHDRLLIYFAGHGFTDPNASEGFAVFADTKLESDDPHHHTALAYGYLSDLLHQAPVNHILLIIDSCYGGNFARTGDFSNLLANIQLPTAPREELIVRAMEAKSRIYLASGDAHHAVSDGVNGQHSPFANALLNVLKTNAGQNKLLHVADIYRVLAVLPSKPTSGYFFPGAFEAGADFLFVPRENQVAALASRVRPIPVF